MKEKKDVIDADNLKFCVVCKQYDFYDKLAKFSRRAGGHPDCLLRRHGIRILRRIVPAHLFRFPKDVVRKYPGATKALREAKRMWEPASV